MTMKFTPPNRHASEEEMQAAVEKVWNEFWIPILTRPVQGDDTIYPIVYNADGIACVPNEVLEQIKSELYDCWVMIESLGRVYDHITCGAVSKEMTSPEAVMSEADESYAVLARDNVKEWIDLVAETELTKEEIVQSAHAWFEIPIDGEVPSDPIFADEESD